MRLLGDMEIQRELRDWFRKNRDCYVEFAFTELTNEVKSLVHTPHGQTVEVRWYTEEFRSKTSNQVFEQMLKKIDQAIQDARDYGEAEGDLSQLKAELAKYKQVVKELSFRLEMAKAVPPGAVLKEEHVRMLALEQAAEFLMDHGIITSGGELERVCEQIKSLPRTAGTPLGPSPEEAARAMPAPPYATPKLKWEHIVGLEKFK